MIRLSLIFLLLITSCRTSLGQDAIEVIAKLEHYLTSAHEAYRFNGVALVLHENQVILNKGYGFSDMRLETPNTPDTRFPILSITKTFTSTIILKLQDEKKLTVNDKLSKYFPDYPNGSKIRIQHLLTHSSGIYNYTLEVGIEDSAIVNYPISKESVLGHFRDKPLDFSPGKFYSYSNSGYFLLGLIIERVTGKPYETVVREKIFRPLGMTQSGFDFINLPTAIRAQGYQVWNIEKADPYKHFDSTFAYSAGSIYSTTNDMLKWANAVAAGKILSSRTWKLAFQPKIQNYGFGWQTGKYSGRDYVKHSGGYPGYMSEFIYYPDEKLTIVLLNNFGNYEQNVWSVGMGITSIVLGLPYDNWTNRKEVKVNESVLQRHAGTYVNGKNKIEVAERDSELYIVIPGLPEMDLHPESNNDFFLRNFNTTLQFRDDTLIVHEHGSDSQWTKRID